MSDNLIFFINAFLFELEESLNNNLAYFDDVKFQFDEANTDQQIKIKIKEFILSNFKSINSVTEIKSNGKDIYISKDDFSISNVKVPSELTDDDRNYIRSTRNAVYTNPDLLFIITDGENNYRIPVEVKSTKNNNIPGSSIQQIDANDWVIFLKHDDKHILEFVTGKYIDAISGTMQFPDRSPRPQVSYNILKNWNRDYRTFKNGILAFEEDKDKDDKLQLIEDWQMLLSKRWLGLLKQKKKFYNEPWFNNNIRKFSVLLLEYYDSLSNEEKQEYINFIKDNITGETND